MWWRLNQHGTWSITKPLRKRRWSSTGCPEAQLEPIPKGRLAWNPNSTLTVTLPWALNSALWGNHSTVGGLAPSVSWVQTLNLNLTLTLTLPGPLSVTLNHTRTPTWALISAHQGGYRTGVASALETPREKSFRWPRLSPHGHSIPR